MRPSFSRMTSFTRTAVIFITFCALFIFGLTLVQSFYSPASEVTVPNTGQELPTIPEGDAGAPSRLIIPDIKVDAHVQHVGIGRTGNMAVPTNYSDVGWYRYGTVPGQVGSAVVDGHVDNAFGLAGVFKDLAELREGDDVYVETKDGTRLRFVVEEVVTYDYKSVPPEKLFERTDGRRLNLITCGGTWLPREESYDKRIVVYTRLAGE